MARILWASRWEQPLEELRREQALELARVDAILAPASATERPVTSGVRARARLALPTVAVKLGP